MSEYNGDDLYNAIMNNDIELSLKLILDLKAHIKRDLINLSFVPQYFDSLLIAFKIPKLSIAAFSTICHLVKRVSIQDSKLLKLFDNQIIPFLIDRLLETKISIKNTAKKAIETYWSSVPEEFILIFKNYGLKNKNPFIKIGVLSMLKDIIKYSSNFSFKPLMPDVICLLNDKDLNVVNSSTDLLILFFKNINPNNKSAKLDLVNELINFKIDKKISINLLLNINKDIIFDYENSLDRLNDSNSRFENNFDTSENSVNYGDSNEKNNNSNDNSNDNNENNSYNNINKSENDDEDLNKILNNIPNYAMDNSIKPKDINDENYLFDLTEKLMIPFAGKESEQNWLQRQQCIIELRSLVRGNAVIEFTLSLSQCIKTLKDCIAKSILSLRTTLSNNACQLSKELGIFIGSFLDPFTAETLFHALIKLTYARKSIMHQNANAGAVGLLLYTNSNLRLMNLILVASQDKNIQPRAYVGGWIRLLLLRFKNDKSTLDQFIDSFEKILVKGLSDPMPIVKESMRGAFWSLNSIYPNIGDKIIKKLDPNTVRALEKIKNGPLSNSNRSSSRRSVRELILAKQKELEKEKKKDKDKEKETNLIIEHENELEHEQEGKIESHKKLLQNEINIKEKLTRERSLSMGTDYDKKIKQRATSRISQRASSLGILNHEIKSKDNKIKDENLMEDFTERMRRQNNIYDLITSTSTDLQKKGFTILLNEPKDRLSIKFNSALNNLSIINPLIFSEIFNNLNFFRFISSYLTTENIIRLYCIHTVKNPLSLKQLDLLINELPLEDLCLAITNTLSFSIDASKIDDMNLSIQYNKYKHEFLKTIFSLLYQLLKSNKISKTSYLLSTIFESLFQCFEIINSDLEVNLFKKLLELSNDIFNDIFNRCLNDCNDVIKNEIYKLLNIKNDTIINDSSSPLKVNLEFDENVDELTKVIPRRIDINELNKNMFVSDMTMINPFKRKIKDDGHDDHNLKVEVAVDGQDENKTEVKTGNKEQADGKNNEIINIDDVFKDDDEVCVMDVDSSINENKENEKLMSDSTPDMNQLTINEDKENKDNIIVFEDSCDSWYALWLKELRMDYSNIKNFETNLDIDTEKINYNTLLITCWNIENNKLEIKEINNIYESILHCLPNLPNGLIIIGLVILETCLIKLNNSFDEKQLLTHTLNLLNDNTEENELFFSIFELFKHIEKIQVLFDIKLDQLNVIQKTIILLKIEELVKLRKITGEDVFLIERILTKTINDDESNIRKESLKIFSELYKLSIEGVKGNENFELVDKIMFKDLDEDLKKMIEVTSSPNV